MPKDRKPIDPASIANKNAGPTGCVLMVDANREWPKTQTSEPQGTNPCLSEVWDVPQAVEYMKKLEPLKPWFIEEPTAPDDAVGHASIRKALKPLNIGVATGEHAHNRVSRLFAVQHNLGSQHLLIRERMVDGLQAIIAA